MTNKVQFKGLATLLLKGLVTFCLKIVSKNSKILILELNVCNVGIKNVITSELKCTTTFFIRNTFRGGGG